MSGGGRLGDVSGGIVVREEGDGYRWNAVGNWEVVDCAGTDDRRGLGEVGVT